MDAAHLGGGEIYLVGLFNCKEGTHGDLVSKIKLGMRAGDDALGGMPLCQQLADDGGAHHAAVAGDVDFGFCAHASLRP